MLQKHLLKLQQLILFNIFWKCEFGKREEQPVKQKIEKDKRPSV